MITAWPTFPRLVANVRPRHPARSRLVCYVVAVTVVVLGAVSTDTRSVTAHDGSDEVDVGYALVTAMASGIDVAVEIEIQQASSCSAFSPRHLVGQRGSTIVQGSIR